jgi:hypothetical protein
MSFIGGDTDSLKFVLTNKGKQILIEKGWENLNIYYTFFDDDVNYTINSYPNLISDINGVENKVLDDNTKYRYNLK